MIYVYTIYQICKTRATINKKDNWRKNNKILSETSWVTKSVMEKKIMNKKIRITAQSKYKKKRKTEQ